MFGITPRQLLVFGGLFVASMLLTSIVVIAFVVLIPADHLVSEDRPSLIKVRSPALRLALRIGRNILGFLLVCVGIVLAIPGVPGQGALTILVGLLLLDIPGKHKLLLRIVGRPRVLRLINRLRMRYGRAPLSVGTAELSAGNEDSSEPDDVSEP